VLKPSNSTLGSFDVINVIFLALGTDDAFKESCLNVDLNLDLGHEVQVSNNVIDHVIGKSKLRIDFHAKKDQNSWDDKNKVFFSVLRLLIDY
jgi:hypothetical protein